MKIKTFHVSKSIILVDEIKTSFVVTNYLNLSWQYLKCGIGNSAVGRMPLQVSSSCSQQQLLFPHM